MVRRSGIFLATVGLALGLSGTALGQGRLSPLVNEHQKLVYILETSLRSDIKGVVEGTIYNTIQYKSYFPGRDFSRLIADLNDLSASDPDSEISFKAHLASMFLRYGSSLDAAASFDPGNHERAFQLASDQLTRKFLFTHATQ